MGTKFGNIHVKTDQIDEVVSALKQLAASMKTGNALLTGTLAGFEHLIEQAQRSRKVFYIGKLRPGWVSILNDHFGWGEAEALGEKLSGCLSSPVMTIAYFDDDLFEWNVYQHGKRSTGQLWCDSETLDVYGLENKKADLDTVAALIGIEHYDKLQQLLNIEDCEEAIQQLQQTMQIPLWIHSDWFSDMNDDDDREWIAKYGKYDLNEQS